MHDAGVGVGACERQRTQTRQNNSDSTGSSKCLRWQDLSGHEDLLHQFRQDVEEVRQVQVDVVVLVQLGRVELGTRGGMESRGQCDTETGR